MPLLGGQKNIGRNIEEMEAHGHPHDVAVAAALNTARKARAEGGHDLMKKDGGSVRKYRDAGGALTDPYAPTTRFHVGPIHSAVAGRTDHLPITVESGSYVLPADIVSAGGSGNTLAGFKVLRRTFGGEPYGQSTAPYGQKGGVYGLPVTYARGGKAAAGILFLSPDDKVLLMRRTEEDGDQGKWAFPAGGVKKGETPDAAAKRETREETGHDHDGGLAPFMHSNEKNLSFTTYLAHAPRFTPKLNHEHDRAEWVSLDDAEKFPLHPGVRAALNKLKARATKAHGGESSGVPIVAAGGEWVIGPDQVRRIGSGDIDVGHRVLDKFVHRVRRELIGTLQKLPGPRKD
jgi:8-oxo-dGTP pyrophosphatase MutT (NUDIX family)